MKNKEANRVLSMFACYYESFEANIAYKIPKEKGCDIEFTLAEARVSDNFVARIKDLSNEHVFCLDGKKLYLEDNFENSDLFSIDLNTSKGSDDSNVKKWNSGIDPRDRAYEAMKRYENMPHSGNNVINDLERSSNIVSSMYGIIEAVFDA